MEITVQEVVKQLCKMGLSGISVSYDSEKDMLAYDLNTQAKSGLDLYEDFTVRGRYNYVSSIHVEEWSTIEDIIKDLFWEFRNFLCGRDYCNGDWNEIGVQLGLLEKKVTTHTTTEYI